MSTYNGERFISEAIDSILKQTFPHFELIVIDDGSTDGTPNVLQTIQDNRVTIIRHRKNLGIAASQNRAIAVAKGEYLALMDHDDVSVPERLQVQVDFLDQHPKVALVGSSCISIDENGVSRSEPYSTDEVMLKWMPLLCNCPLFHTSLMVRRSAVAQVGGYSGNYLYAGDYELISKLVAQNAVANLPQPLVKWRAHNSSTSSVHARKLTEEATDISRRNINRLLGDNAVDPEVWTSIQSLLLSNPTADINISGDQTNRALSFLLHLQNSFYDRNHFPRVAVNSHRRQLYWTWGKHLLALAYRQKGHRDLACRATLLKWAAKLLLGIASGRVAEIGRRH